MYDVFKATFLKFTLKNNSLYLRDSISEEVFEGI